MTSLRLLRPYGAAIAVLLITVLLSAVAEALGLVLLSTLLSTIVPGSASPSRGVIASLQAIVGASTGRIFFLLGSVYVGKSLLALWTTYASYSLALRMARDWSVRLLHGYLITPYRRLTREQGSMMHMVLGETTIAAGSLATGGILAQNALSTASVYVALLALSPLLTLGLTAMAAVAIAAVFVLSRYAQRIATRRLRAWETLNNDVLEIVSALKQLRLFGLEAEAELRASAQLAKGHSLQRTSSVIGFLPRVIIEIIFLLGLGAVFGLLVPALGASIVIADIGLVAAAAFRLLPSLTASASTWIQLQQAWPSLHRIAMELAYLEEGEWPKHAGHRAATMSRGILVEDVHFGYPGREPALRGVSLEIPRGGLVGIVGPSGAGKSTLVDLLCGFYEPDSGRILVDGVDLRDIDSAGWRRNLGVVAQDNFLMNMSLRDNLLILRPTAGNAELDRVVSLVGADELIRQLPRGYDTRVGERGVRLSGGQRQRLALARVLLKAPELLVLDEATSALDARSDERIRQQLQELRGTMTVVVIAHRLSSVRDADRIYVISQGQVEEQGTHDELLRVNGTYAAMWRAMRGARRVASIPPRS